MGKDLYGILGISKNADDKEIKKAYMKMAKKYHPDINKNDKQAEEKFREVQNAYDILKDTNKRKRYDMYGDATDSASHGNSGFSSSGQGFEGFSSFSDIFSDFFGGGGSAGSSQSQDSLSGEDLRYDLTLTLEEAFAGIKKNISFTTFVVCSSCSGAGSKKPNNVKRCRSCNGHGKVKTQQAFFIIEKVCQECSGSGNVIESPCSQCHGAGRVKKNKTLEVDIPAGVDDGVQIRSAGQGEAGIRNSASGDLYIFITLKKDSFFTREGDNLLCEIPIKFTKAILGGTIEVPTIEKCRINLEIPAGSQHGTKFRVKSKGMKKINSMLRGDMYVKIAVEMPINLTSKEKSLLQELDKLLEDRPESSPSCDSFFTKLKSFFK